MRVAILMALLAVASCASEKLALAPPAGVDFSGHWKLNEADSDDPQRLMLAAVNPSASSPAGASGSSGGPGGPGGSGGRGGGGGRQGGRGGGGMPMGGGAAGGPATPPLNAIGEGLHWPGKNLEIKQIAGVVAFTSGGINRLCQPTEKLNSPGHHPDRDDRDDRDDAQDRSRLREDPPVRCGWSEKTLIVQGGDPDEDRPPFEEHYSVSEDGQRLIEVVGFKGGRSNGFTMSRVWDKLQQ